MEDKYKTLSVLLLGIVIGMGYSVACGSGSDDGTSAEKISIPGVAAAMAQSGGCAQWEIVNIPKGGLEERGGVPSALVGSTTTYPIMVVPDGWTPLSGEAGSVWSVRCAQ